jgi:hypothetical protein
MKVDYLIIYPAVSRSFPSQDQRNFSGELNVGCTSWQANTAMRHGMCELLFAGCGNHPGNDLGPDFQFDSGDQGINNVHRQWETYKTRSMSIGDVICLDPNGLEEWWICDTCGFTLLTDEQVTSWLTFTRQYGCSFIELNDWLDTQTTKVGDEMTV